MPHRQDVIVAVAAQTEGAHGRAILNGIADFAHAQRLSWRFQTSLVFDDVWLSRGDVAGIITEIRDPKQFELLQQSTIPAVITSGVPAPGRVPFVGGDHAAVGRLGAEYFIDLGFRHLAFVSSGENAFSNLRRDAFAQTARAHGVTCDVFAGDLTRLDERDLGLLRRWLRQLPGHVGIMGANDRMASLVLHACDLERIEVPEYAAVIGVDNDEVLNRLTTPPLSSIDHGARRIGFEAAALLHRLLSGEPAPSSPILVPPAEVITRQSSDTLSLDDPDVAAAVRFIRRNVAAGIHVSDVLAAVPASQRTLREAFRQCLRRTIHEEIVRSRVERAKHLLVATDMPLPRISTECGFSYTSQFSAVFHQETRMSPGVYRRTHRASSARAVEGEQTPSPGIQTERAKVPVASFVASPSPGGRPTWPK